MVCLDLLFWDLENLWRTLGEIYKRMLKWWNQVSKDFFQSKCLLIDVYNFKFTSEVCNSNNFLISNSKSSLPEFPIHRKTKYENIIDFSLTSSYRIPITIRSINDLSPLFPTVPALFTPHLIEQTLHRWEIDHVLHFVLDYHSIVASVPYFLYTMFSFSRSLYQPITTEQNNSPQIRRKWRVASPSSTLHR